MRKLMLLVPLALFAGCVVRTHPYGYRPYQPPPAPRAEVYYYGNHFIPESLGGGWCYLDGPHTHDYYPDRSDWYDLDQGYYWYRGPFSFAFFGGHPLPGGGWCFINGAHRHDYHPPSGGDWRWNRGAYVYQGPFRPNRPPPASYWPRAAPRTDWRANRPVVRPAPAPRLGAPSRVEERNGRPPAPELRERPGASGYAPGHGDNLPPGHGGVPPGQVGRDDDHRGPPGLGRPDVDRRGAPALGRPDDDHRGPPALGRPDDDRRGPPGLGRPDDDRRGPPVLGRPDDDRRGPPGLGRPDDDHRGPPALGRPDDDRRGPPSLAPAAREPTGLGRDRDDRRDRFDRPEAPPAAPQPARAAPPEKKEKPEKEKDKEKEKDQGRAPRGLRAR